MAKIIGSTTTYHGTEHPYLKGYKVRIVAVLKNAARPDIDVDGPGGDEHRVRCLDHGRRLSLGTRG